MKFTITDSDAGKVQSDGAVKGAMGGTEMIKLGLLERLDKQLLNQFNIIHSRVRELDLTKKNILVLHDTWDDPEAQHLRDETSRERFAKFVFVSNYQFQTYHLAHGIPFSKSVVMHNAIEPIAKHEKTAGESLRLIYHTTPHRGLELLVPVFEFLYDKYGSKIELDVYSSFNIYGWPQRDEQYKELFARCEAHPGINYHGTVPNSEIREALIRAHIFAYPSIWIETSCIAALEAMSAGCAVICPNLGALPETTAEFANLYQWDENVNIHANKFAVLLDDLIRNYWSEQHTAKLQFQKMYVDNFYSWDRRVVEWESFLRSI